MFICLFYKFTLTLKMKEGALHIFIRLIFYCIRQQNCMIYMFKTSKKTIWLTYMYWPNAFSTFQLLLTSIEGDNYSADFSVSLLLDFMWFLQFMFIAVIFVLNNYYQSRTLCSLRLYNMRFFPQFDPDLNPNWGHIHGKYCENDICWKCTIYIR